MNRLAFFAGALLLALCGCGGYAPVSKSAAAEPIGNVTSTSNPLVALYTVTLPAPGSWVVAFGPDTNYGRSTNTVNVTTAGAATSVYVAGMLPNTTYHMRATATPASGAPIVDVDHMFTTGALPAGIPAKASVTLGTTGTAPQPGIELVDTITGAVPSTLYATDLQGNTIWTYPFPDRAAGSLLYPGKLLANGDFLVFISPLSYPLGSPGQNILREIDLAGNTVRQLTLADLNTALTTAGFQITLANYSHDFIVLPNGHLLLLTNTSRPFTDLPGFPGVTNVAGDVVVDLDTTWKPVWVWNEFDHFDVNRHPWAGTFPDWTHSNSLDYSTDDGDFIISIRHQNWVVKVNYRDGFGAGDVVWKLGEGGDFALKGGVDPTDWFYAQHDAQFATSNTTGVFSLTIMDNGDDRIFPAGVTCGTAGAPACAYTTIQQLQVDDTAMTATFQSHLILDPALYSNFAGNVEILANGNTEYCLSGVTTGSETYEVTSGANPQTVWEMATPGSDAYRTLRMPSLYPGVQWH